jgi:hypothetical protein
MNDLIVGLSSWIIQDGNYPDLVRGQKAAFALEFHPAQPLSVSAIAIAPFRMHVSNDSNYEVSGAVAYVADDWWVVDIGILVFREERPPAEVRPGIFVQGKVMISIDPYFYFEQLSKRAGAPALIYDWTIDKIEMQTAPMIEVAPKRFARDERLLGWREIEKTDAWNDDGGHAWYLLHCSQTDSHPRHSLRGR